MRFISSLALFSSSLVLLWSSFNDRCRMAWIKAAPRHHNTMNNVNISPMLLSVVVIYNNAVLRSGEGCHPNGNACFDAAVLLQYRVGSMSSIVGIRD